MKGQAPSSRILERHGRHEPDAGRDLKIVIKLSRKPREMQRIPVLLAIEAMELSHAAARQGDLTDLRSTEIELRLRGGYAPDQDQSLFSQATPRQSDQEAAPFEYCACCGDQQ